MMAVVIPNRLRTMILANRLDDSPMTKISGNAMTLFTTKMEEIAEEVCKEAANGIYDTLLPIDIQRGFDMWMKRKLPKEITLKIV